MSNRIERAKLSRLELWTVEYIRSKCRISPDGCWLWNGAERESPIGTHQHKKFSIRRHIACAIQGKSGAGRYASATCGEAMCVCPDHVRLITHSANSKTHAVGWIRTPTDIQKARQARIDSGSAKLDMQKARAIRADSRTNAELARVYGVSAQAISLIRSGKTWRETRPASIFNLGGIAA